MQLLFNPESNVQSAFWDSSKYIWLFFAAHYKDIKTEKLIQSFETLRGAVSKYLKSAQ